MSESSGEKTEPPTEKRKTEARNKGQVVRSADVVSTALLLGVFVYFLLGWQWLLAQCLGLFTQTAAVLPFTQFDETANYLIGKMAYSFMTMMGPLLGVVILAAIAGNVGQFGFLFTMETMKPELKKLSPMEGAKKIFSKRAVFGLFMNTAKVFFLGFLLYFAIKGQLGALLVLPTTSPETVLQYLPQVFYQLFIYTILAFAIFAAVDYAYQWSSHFKQLKMSKDEVKREYKEQEGDPLIKGKRKQLARELAMNEMVERTRQASVLVTNPTHRAVALYYNKDKGQLPFVIAKGEGALAQAMIQAARDAKIPIMQNVPLAHELYETGTLMEYIPTELIKPVAEVLKWVEREGRTA